MNPLDLIPAPYRVLTTIALIAALLGGTYYKGYARGHKKAETEIAAFSGKLKDATITIERQQSKINEHALESTYVKIDTVKVRIVNNVNKLVSVPGPIVFVTDTLTRVELPIGWVSLHNAGAGNYNANVADASNATASGITPNDALSYILKNYGLCAENATKLEALQNWIKQSSINVEKVNKKP